MDYNERNNRKKIKKKCNNETLPKHLIDDKIETNYAESIAEKCYTFFVHIEPNLAKSSWP